MQIWSTNYSLHFGSVKIRKHCLYWNVFSTNIHRKTFFQQFASFLAICLSANCMSLVSKFFLTSSEFEARFILEGFKYCPLWKVNFQLSGAFFAFFIWSVNCIRGRFQLFCQSANCIS